MTMKIEGKESHPYTNAQMWMSGWCADVELVDELVSERRKEWGLCLCMNLDIECFAAPSKIVLKI